MAYGMASPVAVLVIQLVVLGCACGLAVSQPVQLFVATTGHDGNNATSRRFPVRSPQVAIYLVELYRARHNYTGDVDVLIGAGTYELMQPLALNGDSCGVATVGSTVRFMRDPLGPPGRVILSGGSEVTLSQSPALGADVFEATLPKGQFPQEFLFQMWTMANERRSLSTTDMLHYEVMITGTQVAIVLAQNETKTLAGVDMARHVLAYVYHSWTSSIATVAGLNQTDGVISFASQMPENFFNFVGDGNRYRLVNLRNLDGTPATVHSAFEPGSFLFDPTTRKVTYRATPDEIMANQTSLRMMVPRLGSMLSVHDCQGAALTDISMYHTDSYLNEQCLDTSCDGQSGNDLTMSTVSVTASREVRFERVEIAHIGGYALWAKEGTRYISVLRCHIHDSGAGGVRIGKAAKGRAKDPDSVAQFITVSDTTIHDEGFVVEAGTGIFAQQVANVTIVHNKVYNSYYTGISVGWTWGYAPTSNGHNNISFNEVYNIGRGRLSDMGCIYHLGIENGRYTTQVTNNLCHDVQSYGYGGWGLYADEGTSNVLYRDNIVYRTKGAAFHQHYGLDNLVVNNVLAFPQWISVAQYATNGEFAALRHFPAQGHIPQAISSFVAERNILLLRNATASLFFGSFQGAFKNVTLDHNCYWNDKVAPDDLQFPTAHGNTTWHQWHEEGKDIHSILDAPQFIDPNAYNFTAISSASLCVRKLGFRPISLKFVGPR